MFTTGRRSFLFNFFSLLSILLLLHLGCFTFSSRHRRRDSSSTSTSTSSLFKKKLTRPPKPGLVSFLRRLFSSSINHHTPTHPPTSIPSPSSSTRSLRLNPPPTHQSDTTTTTTTTTHAKNGADDQNQIQPCSVCGEIFHSATLLKHHQSTNHAVSDLVDGENIVRIIFKTGWPDKAKRPTIHRILKIHSSPRILTRFEDHREFVKSRAAAAKTIKQRDERCIADGNELLRFHCTTFICGLDSTICSHQYCSACGIIRTGFSHKMDGISTMPTSWKAHAAVPEDLEEEFSFMHVKRALLVCRVVAGRVGCEPSLADKTDRGFDSLVGQEDDELLVFNPKAVLPCFVIVYTV
ncbi:hypothetical protein ABFX02_11G058100 [Erythranthe guttata]